MLNNRLCDYDKKLCQFDYHNCAECERNVAKIKCDIRYCTNNNDYGGCNFDVVNGYTGIDWPCDDFEDVY